jgi:predicted Rossmann fold flavoprotein
MDDVVIVGAGAAGLMCGITAAERGKSVRIIEKSKKPGVKILMSGGTRCNITHNCDARGIIAAFGRNGAFLHSALAAFSPQDAVDFFHAEGVLTKVEETGKIFPQSDKALDVLNALLRRLHRSGASLSLAEPAMAITRLADGGFEVATNSRSIRAHNVVIATGGKSYPGCGTTGDGYAFARSFGHSITPTAPALVPLRIAAAWTADLQGVTLPNVTLSVIDGDAVLAKRSGSMLFAHFGLTGPAPLDVSRAVSLHAEPTRLTLAIDFLPGMTAVQVDDFLRIETPKSGKQLLASVLSRLLTRRICDALLGVCTLDRERTAAALSRQDRTSLVAAIKDCRVPMAGTLGYEKAEVTTGGVALAEVHSKSLESKLQPGLYLIGEVLDLDGWIGGYNFQSAWSTGTLCGRSIP